MPLMRPPPTFKGSYNGLVVDAVANPGVMIDVLERDVLAHEAEGWELYADTTMTVPATPEGEE